MNIDNDKLILYLSDTLSEKDKKDFEKEISSNKELKLLINDLKNNDKVLSSMNNNIKVSSDFMIKLNEKIDAYEEKTEIWYIKLFKKIPLLSLPYSRSEFSSKYAFFSLLLIISFTAFKINSTFLNNIIVESDDEIELIANAPDNENLNDSLKTNINEDNNFIYNNNKISK